MYKEVLRHISGIEIFPVISLIIFFSFFVITTIIWMRKSKKEIEELANIPLDDADKIIHNETMLEKGT